MGHMGHCRFQNTLEDLRDCFENMEADNISDQEKSARRELLKLCDRIAVDYVVDGEPLF